MSKRKINFVKNEYYHIYNRGNSKQTIFLDEQDYKHFRVLLYICNQKGSIRRVLTTKKSPYLIDRNTPLVYIGAYTLMPNHFHILLTPAEDEGISIFMQKLSTAYSMYFNKKYSRTGSLFEGKFKSEHADTDKYLKYLFSYIHLNPIKLINKNWKKSGIKDKKKTLQYLSSYLYSSYQDYLNIQKPENAILNKKQFPEYFSNKESFEKEILVWINYVQALPGHKLIQKP